MPQGLDGSWNIAGLQVPGVYIDIIPPSPNLVGVPTNKVGLVGVGSWGPLNAVIPVSAPSDAVTKIGVPLVRPHDIASYIEAGNQLGTNAAYQCVRVSDGTDTAAAATIQSTCITLTAKYTGTLGNSITYTAAAGTQPGSFMFILGFPGVTAEVYNNIGNGVSAITVVAGTTFASVPTATLTTTFTAPGAISNVTPVITPTLSVYGTPTIGSSAGTGFLANDFVTFSNGVVMKVATVSSGAILTFSPIVTAGCSGGLLTGGNIPTNPISMISTTSVAGAGPVTANVTWGLGTPIIVNPGNGVATCTIALTSGGGTGGSYTTILSPWLNLANAINNGNSSRPFSKIVVALAGVGIAAPTLATITTLSGGTDGAASVTDTTMIGQDILPRKGMYALRNAGTNAFTCCDVATYSVWPAMDAFALSEGTTSCVSDISGNTIAQAIAARLSVGLDDEWTWITAGDYPNFYDPVNQITRQISPSAYQVAFIGNSSPEQSPLNKVLRGIVSTAKTLSFVPYADADLLAANIGGIDLIIGPPSTIGGNYYTFATGRNASSNTAANGVEYTTMTNFLANSANNKAAGSIVGLLQSIQSNDATRARATAVFNSFSSQLASPVSGSNGYGLIDVFSVQCNLANNPADLQARGYLFLYWTVRYLNVVRYFIVKLAGGGNVVVTIQATPPSPAQFQ